MPSHRILASLALAATLALAPAAALAAPKPRATAGSTTFVKLVTHPQAVAQPTAMGRTIATLKGWNGQLYSGYGDYGANTGPIAISPLSASAFAAAPAIQADTEAVWIYREMGGRLYAPSIDPRGSSDFAVGTTSSWASASPFAATHVFDVMSLTGTDQWAVGSSGVDAVAWRSLDGGATWAEALRATPQTAGDYSRFYGAGVLNGRLYVQAMDATAGLHPRSKVFDGTAWSDGPTLSYVLNHAEQFAGRLVAHGTYHSAHYSGPLVAFDGARSTAVQSSIYDYAIAGDTLYTLGTDRAVRSTKDLTTWTQVATAPTVARSIGVLDGVLYAGGTDAAIYVRK